MPATSSIRLCGVRLASLLVSLTLALGAGAGIAQPAGAASSLGGGSAFSELTQGEREAATTASTPTATTSSTQTTNSSSTLLIALVAAVLVLSAIGFVIVRDARRVAPAGDADLLEARSGRDAAVQMRKRRAKAKAARRQRKRNR